MNLLLIATFLLFFLVAGFLMGASTGYDAAEKRWARWCDRQDIPVPTREELERKP